MAGATSILQCLDFFPFSCLGVDPSIANPGALVVDDADQRFHHSFEVRFVDGGLLAILFEPPVSGEPSLWKLT
jgi:hypothetical protein